MSMVPVGKVLLRNLMRHTDAHNKIQEESEMWKLRGMERQAGSATASSHRWTPSNPWPRGNMHCDRYFEDTEGSAHHRLGERECLSERDEREARYWSRKLYEFEANDPDRWGHSGFKELYPEEFESDRETECKRSQKNGKEKISSNKHKSSRKSSKKKKKKKKRTRSPGPSSASDGSVADCLRRKPKRKSKHSHRKKERGKRAKEEVCSESDNSESDRTESYMGVESEHRKRPRTAAGTHTEPERKRRKNWKAANEEKSEENSED